MFQKVLHEISRSLRRIRGLRGWGRLSSSCMFTGTFVRVRRAKSHRLFSQARRSCKMKVAKNIMFYAWIEIKSYGVRLNSPFWNRRAVKIAHQAYKSFRWTYDFKSSVQTSRMSLAWSTFLKMRGVIFLELWSSGVVFVLASKRLSKISPFWDYTN